MREIRTPGLMDGERERPREGTGHRQPAKAIGEQYFLDLWRGAPPPDSTSPANEKPLGANSYHPLCVGL